jgi:hypothetical protein
MRPSCLLLVRKKRYDEERKDSRKVRREELGYPSQIGGWLE